MNKFFARYLGVMVLIIVLIALSGCGDVERVEPLSVEQNQRIIMQIGLDGYKRLHAVKCYDAVVTRVNTGNWSDSYCAGTYDHLNIEAIKHG